MARPEAPLPRQERQADLLEFDHLSHFLLERQRLPLAAQRHLALAKRRQQFRWSILTASRTIWWQATRPASARRWEPSANCAG